MFLLFTVRSLRMLVMQIISAGSLYNFVEKTIQNMSEFVALKYPFEEFVFCTDNSREKHKHQPY